MAAEPRIIVITEPEPRLSAAGEAEYLTLLMQGGAVSDVHLRYPGNEVRTLRVAEKFPAEMRERLHLHYFPEPAGRLGCGVHLKAGEKPGNVRATRSCHSLEEARMYPEAEYLFLSPIFDSISKQGYCSQFPARGLLGGVPGNTVALGGVTPRHFLQLMRLGFRGAAMLGWVWSGAGREEAQRKREVIRRFRNAWAGFRLQFITNAPTAGQTAAQAVQAIKGGCRWVQIRMKEAGEEEIRRAVELTAPEARKAGSILLIDDHVELAAEMEEIDGVHLGHSDMPRSEARKILGEEKIIGSTANTPEQAVALAPESDYLGVGPYRFTTTKRKLAPTLGAAGLQAVSQALAEAGLATPVVGIGGITLRDVEAVAESGVQGVAVSGAISGAAEPTEAARAFSRECDRYFGNNKHNDI